ncbi:MAG: DEAD/DEAH box helicase [Candidatus Dojkabacteria bacterium]|nr:DEAD/DEAH box helicase [Candidatus Dojkabacteria bacterium]
MFDNYSFEIINELELVSEEYSNIDLVSLIHKLHFPVGFNELDESVKTLSALELTDIHLRILNNKSSNIRMPVELKLDESYLNEFMSLFPFTPTKDQTEIIKNIFKSLKDGVLLNDLVQGDVGSGKTLIAMFIAFIVAKSGYQTAILAPTTILAAQHYENLSNIFKEYTNIEVSLVTSSNTKHSNESNIIIGTTALLSRKKRVFNKLGAVIVDEQHRFGVHQRSELLSAIDEQIEDNRYPHFINMTATPIPRTIAETFFSDIKLHTIKTKPKGRMPIKTFVVPESKRNDSYKWVEEKIKSEGVQVYWICPLIEDSASLQVKSAKALYEQLVDMYPDLSIGLLYGKMKDIEKEAIMNDYADKKYDILVSTSVIEVGIDVANATIMIIENAERFGLAQLHQIRGRVGRNDTQSYCFLFADSNINEHSLERLSFIANNNDGLDVANFDLEKRGPGEVYGTKQSGIPDLKIAKLNDIELIKKTKSFASILYKKKIKRINLFK